MPAYFHSFVRDVRELPRALWVLVGGQFINRFGSFVHPFLALYLSGSGLSLDNVALVLGAISIGHLVAPVASGYFADAFGRRNTIVVSLAGGAVTMLGIYACESVGALVVVAMVHGFFAFLFGPAANALLTDLVRADLRVTAYALLRLAINAGFAAGPAVAGILFTRAPLLIFVGDAATTLIFAVMAWRWLPHGLRTIDGRTTSLRVVLHSWREALADAWLNRPYVQLLVGQLLMAIAFLQVVNVLALDATAHGLSPSVYGMLMGFNGVLIVVCEIPLAQWVKRYDARRVLTIGFAVVGVGCAAFAFARTIEGYLWAMALYTLGEMLSLPVASGYAARLAPDRLRGRYFGLNGVMWSVAGLCGSSGVWFHGVMGSHWWLWTGAVGVAAGVVMCVRVADQRARAVVPAAVGVR